MVKTVAAAAALSLAMLSGSQAQDKAYLDMRWGPLFSEETGPMGDGSPITWVGCHGSHCDDKNLYHASASYCRGYQQSWTYWVSEETPVGAQCPLGQYVGRIECSGRFCDNVRLECWSMFNSPNCKMGVQGDIALHTGACPAGSVVVGLTCTGTYCESPVWWCMPLTYQCNNGQCDHSCHEGHGLEWLSRHHIAAPENNEVIQGFRLTFGGCSANHQQFKVTSVHSDLGTCSTKFTPCNAVRGQMLQNLDRHHVSCSAGEVLKSWRMTAEGCGGADLRLKYECCRSEDYGRQPVASKMTTCSDGRYGTTVYPLDYHEVKCDPGSALSGFHVDYAGCSSTQFRIAYQCSRCNKGHGCDQRCHQGDGEWTEGLERHLPAAAPGSAMQQWRLTRDKCAKGSFRVSVDSVPTGLRRCTSRSTDCNDIYRRGIDYLDRHPVRCPDGEVMKNWRMTTEGCSGTFTDRRFEYECCTSDFYGGAPALSHTGCQDVSGQGLPYLDRHDIRCQPGFALSGFHMLPSVNNLECGPGKSRMEYWCLPCKHPHGCDERCYPSDGHKLQAISGKILAAPPGLAAAGFSFVRSECPDGKMRVSGRFLGAEVTSCRTMNTPCNEVGDRFLQYLDRHHPSCGSQVMTSWEMTSSGCSKGEQRIRYTCCNSGKYGGGVSNVERTACGPVVNEYISSLEHHRVQCPGGKVLSGFRLLQDGASGCGGGGRSRVELTCLESCSSSRTDLAPGWSGGIPNQNGIRSLSTKCSGRAVDVEKDVLGFGKLSFVQNVPGCPECVKVKLGDNSWLSYKSEEDRLHGSVDPSSSLSFFLHHNHEWESLVLEVRKCNGEQRQFVTFDPVEMRLVLTETPSECSLFQRDVEPEKVKTVLETMVRDFEEAPNREAMKTAIERAKKLSGVADKYCPAGDLSGRPYPEQIFCKLRGLDDSWGYALQVSSMPNRHLVDLSKIRGVDLKNRIKEISAASEEESRVKGSELRILEQMNIFFTENRADINLINENLKTISDNTKGIANSWHRVRSTTVGFENGLASGDIATNFKKATDRIGSSWGWIKTAAVKLIGIYAASAAQIALEILSGIDTAPWNWGKNAAVFAEGAIKLAELTWSSVLTTKALKEVVRFLPDLLKVIRNLGALEDAMNDLKDVQDDDTTSYNRFLKLYAGFEGGDIVKATNVFSNFEIALSGMCSISNGGTSLCVGLSQDGQSAANQVSFGIEAAWAAADDMGRKARGLVELNSLDKYKEEVEGLPDTASLDFNYETSVREWKAKLSVPMFSFKLAAANHKVTRFELSMLFCASQFYNFAGELSDPCKRVWEQGFLPLSYDSINLLVNTAPITDRVLIPADDQEKNKWLANIPAGKGSVGYGSRSERIDLHELLNGREVTLNVPTDTEWLRRNRWLRGTESVEDVSIYLNALKVYLPVNNDYVELEVNVRTSPINRILVRGRERTFRTAEHHLRHKYAVCAGERQHEAGVYSHCESSLPGYCRGEEVSRISDPSNGLEDWESLPSLHTPLTLSLKTSIPNTLLSQLGMSAVDAMSIYVEVEGVKMYAVNTEPSLPAVRTADLLDSGCCGPAEHMSDWSHRKCSTCPSGTVPASGGMYCSIPHISRTVPMTPQENKELGPLLLGNDAFVFQAVVEAKEKPGSWARVFDFGNGPDSDNIFLAFEGPTGKLILRLYHGGIVVGDVRVEDEFPLNKPVEVTVIISPVGDMAEALILLDGKVEAYKEVPMPKYILRIRNYIGKSNWPDRDFTGSIHNVRVSQGAVDLRTVPVTPDENGALGPLMLRREAFVFQAVVEAKEKPGFWARVFDFGNGAPSDNILLGFRGETGKLALQVYHGSNNRVLDMVVDEEFPLNRAVDVKVIIYPVGQGALALIILDGEVVQKGNVVDLPLPVLRNANYIGKSNWPQDKDFTGKISDVKISV